MHVKGKSHIGHSVRNHIVGYCHSVNHKGYVTKRVLGEHKCVEKNCGSFEKYDCEYWNQLRDKKVVKCLAKFYVKNMDAISGLTKDSFIIYIKNFYGSARKIPFDGKTLSISDALEDMRMNGYISKDVRL